MHHTPHHPPHVGGIVERAYDLAKSGRFQGLDGIKAQLRAEGFNQFEVRDTFEGSAIRQSLRQLCKDARSNSTQQ